MGESTLILASFKAILMLTLTSFISFLIVDSPGCDIDVIASTCWCHKPFVVRSKLFLRLVYHLNLGCSQSNQFIGFPSPSFRFHGKPTDTRRRGGEIVYFERFLNCKVSSCLDQFFSARQSASRFRLSRDFSSPQSDVICGADRRKTSGSRLRPREKLANSRV